MCYVEKTSSEENALVKRWAFLVGVSVDKTGYFKPCVIIFVHGAVLGSFHMQLVRVTMLALRSELE